MSDGTVRFAVNGSDDVVRAGKVRVGLFPPQYERDAVSGELRGFAVDLARALGARLGVDVQLVECLGPRKVMDHLQAERVDLAFLAVGQTDRADFTLPFIQFDFTCLVPAASSISSIATADQPGIRIAVVRDHASTLALSRITKRAELVLAQVPEAAFDLLRSGRADALASVGPWLLEVCADLTGSRVLEESYGTISMGVAVPRGHVGWLAYVSEFIEEAKASGLVKRAIEHTGWREVRLVQS
jgi:polar amino acid transport system substrate-binding protein